MKRFANKRVRHTKDIPSGKAYKKVFESYDISDWYFRSTREETLKKWEAEEWIRDRFETLEEYLIYWEKHYKRK
jgi:phosphatidylserine/phosphatidylglycerophosphate/cardiolipin synthase-like enzyme